LSDKQRAISDYNQAIRLNPKYAATFFNRALIRYDELGDKPGAIDDFQKAATLFREQGDPDMAQSVLDVMKSRQEP
jgi:tetratricopeptide (TPR) repeat protein